MLPSWLSTPSGMSRGFWVMKKMLTPLERISFTTCSIFSSRALETPLNSRWASSKKKTIRGFSVSPTSGSTSNSSESIHSRKVVYSEASCIRLRQSRTFTVPWPPSCWNQSAMFRAGSVKNSSPPLLSRATTPRRMALTLALAMLPYWAEYWALFSATYWSMDFKSLVSTSSSPSSSAILNTMVRISVWVGFKSRILPSSSGPISETVVRRGMPDLPYTSQKATG